MPRKWIARLGRTVAYCALATAAWALAQGSPAQVADSGAGATAATAANRAPVAGPGPRGGIGARRRTRGRGAGSAGPGCRCGRRVGDGMAVGGHGIRAGRTATGLAGGHGMERRARRATAPGTRLRPAGGHGARKACRRGGCDGRAGAECPGGIRRDGAAAALRPAGGQRGRRVPPLPGKRGAGRGAGVLRAVSGGDRASGRLDGVHGLSGRRDQCGGPGVRADVSGRECGAAHRAVGVPRDTAGVGHVVAGFVCGFVDCCVGRGADRGGERRGRLRWPRTRAR